MAMLQIIASFCLLLNLINCNEIYTGGMVSDGSQNEQTIDQDDPHCSRNIHKFYRQMKCEPEFSPNFKCPTSYKCATLEDRSPDMCYYGGRHYPVGSNLTRDMVDFHTPCIQSCQCVRTYEGTKFDCGLEDIKNCSLGTGCKHVNFMENYPCCKRGVNTCNHGKKESVKCVYNGRSYTEGERFFPTDDITCTQCICAAGFNGTLAPPYCEQFPCTLELIGDFPIMLTRGCIPAFFLNTSCCPAAFRCPKPTDQVIKSKQNSASTIKTEKKCRFGKLFMEVGDTLSRWSESKTKEVECMCRVPPIPSCTLVNFTLTEELRKEFAWVDLHNDS